MEHIATWPVTLDASGAFGVTSAGGLGYGLTTQDVSIAGAIRKDRNGTLDTLSQIGNGLGDGIVGCSTMALLMIVGGPHDQEVGRSGLMAFLEAGLVTQVIKNITGRLRPNNSPQDANQWLGPRIGNYAFPSGHMVTATVFSAVLASGYPWGWVFFAVPPLVGWARMYSEAHWASDVFLGACLGWWMATIQAPRLKSSVPVKMTWRHPDQVGLAWVIRM